MDKKGHFMKKQSLIFLFFFMPFYGRAFADINTAKIFFNQGNYEAVIHETKNLIAVNKNDKEAYEILLKTLKLLKKNTEYLYYLDHYMQINPSIDYATIYEAAVKAYLMKNYPLAIHFTQRAHFLKPQDPEPLNLMGVSYFYMNSYKLSIVALRFAIKYSNDVNYYANLARSYAKNGQISEAKKYYSKAIALMPNYKRAFVELTKLEHKSLGIKEGDHHYQQSSANQNKTQKPNSQLATPTMNNVPQGQRANIVSIPQNNTQPSQNTQHSIVGASPTEPNKKYIPEDGNHSVQNQSNQKNTVKQQ